MWIRRGMLELLVGAMLTASASAWGAGWADGLFADQSHDFGSVRRGQQLTHDFVFTNNTAQPLTVTNVRVSCNCTRAYATLTTVPPGSSATIHAEMDTNRFQGSKSVTIFVRFDRFGSSEAQLRIHCVSTDDINKGGLEVDFGMVSTGSSAEKKMNLDYKGSMTWQITGMEHSKDCLKAVVKEQSRLDNTVRYVLELKLTPESADSGVFSDAIYIKTNDTANPSIVVQVKALVEAEITASPNNLRLDSPLTTGQQVHKTIILKAAAPFKIIRAENTHGLFEIKTSPTAKTTQLVVATLTVPDVVDKIPDHIELVTDLDGNKSVSISINR